MALSNWIIILKALVEHLFTASGHVGSQVTHLLWDVEAFTRGQGRVQQTRYTHPLMVKTGRLIMSLSWNITNSYVKTLTRNTILSTFKVTNIDSHRLRSLTVIPLMVIIEGYIITEGYICGALVQFGCYQHRYEWKGLWCSSTVWLLSAQTWVNV